MDRRQFMGAVAAAAFATYDDEEFGPESIDEWGPVDVTTPVGDYEALGSRGILDTRHAAIGLGMDRDEDELPTHGEVFYGPDEITLAIQGDDENNSLSVGLQFDAENARHLGAVLFRAGWEHEQRTKE